MHNVFVASPSKIVLISLLLKVAIILLQKVTERNIKKTY